jgi:RecB family exonuclease
MPLFLSYSLHPAALLEETLGSLAEKHFHFNLRDDFLIVTPYEEARQDVERVLLGHSQLEGVLIGRSILTLSSLIRNLLFHHSRPLPQASAFRMRKSLLAALAAVRPAWHPDLPAQKNLVAELQRLEALSRLTGKTWKPNWVRSLLETWKEDLIARFASWTRSQAADAAWNLIERQKIPFLEKLTDVYFLGFSLPDAELLHGLETLQRTYPKLRLHLSLPPPETLLDKEGWLTDALEKLSSWSDSAPVFHSASSPSLKTRSYPTPLHEVRRVLLEGTRSGETVLFLAPPSGSVRDALESVLSQTYFPEGIATRLDPLASAAAFKALQELERSAAAEPQSFETALNTLFPLLTTARNQAARAADASTLRHLEAVFNLLLEWAQVEKTAPRRLSAAEWAQEIREELNDLDFAAPATLARLFPLRSLDRAGLARVDRVYAMGLTDGTYPPAPRPFQLAEDLRDTLNAHEKRVALDLASRLARRETVLSCSEFSTSGKILKPSLLLTGAREDLPAPRRGAGLPLWASRRHPFFEENLGRERARRTPGACTPDSGNLRGFALESYILDKIRDRPLAATYLDDYAKCPWRFFAKWHLELEEKRVEDLEVEPLHRGRFQHEILERLFRAFFPDYFSRKLYPPRESVETALEAEFQKLSAVLLQREEYREWPPAVVRDQLARLRRQVAGLLSEERLHWDEAEEKLFPRHLEWSFGRAGNPPLAFSLASDLSIPLAGAVDRIDVSADEKRFLVLDYKASSTDDLSRELRELRNFQLFLYLYAARAALFPEAQALGALYWDLKEKKRNQGMVRMEAFQAFSRKPPRGSSFLQEESYQKIWADLEAGLRLALRRILEGDYSLDPPACLGSRCEFSEICRYAEQPR